MSSPIPAPAGRRAASPLGRALLPDVARAFRQAANDNFPFVPARRRARLFDDTEGMSPPGAGFDTHDPMLKTALRHFAQHGLGAAREARRQAEGAFFAGDRQAYDWWHDVCRALDRRMAADMHRQALASGSC